MTFTASEMGLKPTRDWSQVGMMLTGYIAFEVSRIGSCKIVTTPK